MGMFSEINVEMTIKSIVAKIKSELESNEDPLAQAALKKVGRYTLTQFEGNYPEWAEEYEVLFKE